MRWSICYLLVDVSEGNNNYQIKISYPPYKIQGLGKLGFKTPKLSLAEFSRLPNCFIQISISTPNHHHREQPFYVFFHQINSVCQISRTNFILLFYNTCTQRCNPGEKRRVFYKSGHRKRGIYIFGCDPSQDFGTRVQPG